MKTSIYIPAFLFLCGVAIGILIYREFRKEPRTDPQQLTLEQILYIKELHLVKHTYNDLFFLHKKNDKSKAIRAMVQVPVTVTAYINLKEIKLVKQNDSICQIILPHAQLNDPQYYIDKAVVRETRSFQLYAGKDLYPQVAGYMKDAIEERSTAVSNMAIGSRILVQAEAEAKQYIEHLLTTFGHQGIHVTFGDPEIDKEVENFEKTLQHDPEKIKTIKSSSKSESVQKEL
jgi:hypothetical protein